LQTDDLAPAPLTVVEYSEKPKRISKDERLSLLNTHGSYGGGNLLKVVGQGFSDSDIVKVCGRECRRKLTSSTDSDTGGKNVFRDPRSKSSTAPVFEDARYHQGVSSYQSFVCEVPPYAVLPSQGKVKSE